MSVLTRILPERKRLRDFGEGLSDLGRLGRSLGEVAAPFLSESTGKGIRDVTKGLETFGSQTRDLSKILPETQAERLQRGLAIETLQRFAESEAINRESRLGRVRKGRLSTAGSGRRRKRSK